MKQILVAGCGPAGMMAGIAAARAGASVTILEGMEKPGKKLLLTGNGKCNLTNLDPELVNKYHSVGREKVNLIPWIQEAMSGFSVSDTLHFFQELGLLTARRSGYVYPYTGQSSSVLEILLAELKRLKVKLKFNERIDTIQKIPDGWRVSTAGWNYRCDALILCCGSKAAPNTGSDGSGYRLSEQAGHTITPVVPALTALTGKGRSFSSCAGVRCQARVALFTENDSSCLEFAGEERGELQWTEKGISGIVVFQLSRMAALALEKGKRVRAELDFLPDTEEYQLEQLLSRQKDRYPQVAVGEVLSGLLPKKLLLFCLDQNKIKSGSPMNTVTEEKMQKLAETMKHFSLSITGTRSFDQCQVCAGGVPLEEVHAKTLESKLAAGLYFAGELLDVDGPCGGYNLQWAWSSGYTAGIHAAEIV